MHFILKLQKSLYPAFNRRSAHTQRDSPGASTRRGRRTFSSEYQEDGHMLLFAMFYKLWFEQIRKRAEDLFAVDWWRRFTKSVSRSKRWWRNWAKPRRHFATCRISGWRSRKTSRTRRTLYSSTARKPCRTALATRPFPNSRDTSNYQDGPRTCIPAHPGVESVCDIVYTVVISLRDR